MALICHDVNFDADLSDRSWASGVGRRGRRQEVVIEGFGSWTWEARCEGSRGLQ